MIHLLKKTLAFTILLGSMVSVWGQQTKSLPTDPNVRIGKLQNGLTYYIRHNNLPEKQADFYIAQKVGSILEEDNQRGLAHFLEHMCFNGTTHFPDNTLREYLESIGVKFGANLNAYTGVDETVYNINNVPVSREGVIDTCLLILHDWANDLTLADKEIDKERGVIKEEWRTRSSAMMRMYEQIFPIIFPGSKYGHRMPIGTMEVVEHFPYKALRDYYEKWYRPDQQGIIVVGDINVDEIEAKIKKLFSPIKMPSNPAPREYFPVPDNDEPIVAIASDKEQTTPIVQIMFKHNSDSPEQKNSMMYLVKSFVQSMATTMLNDRLVELTQKANPPYLQAGVQDENFIIAKTKDAFIGYIATRDTGVVLGFETLLTEIERVRRFGFTKSEYARAKANYLRVLESAYNERNKRKSGSYVQDYVQHFIDGEPIIGIENEYKIMNELVPNIPIELINKTIQQVIGEKNIVITAYYPKKEGVNYPDKAALLNILDKVRKEELSAYVDKVTNEPLMSEKPKPGKVVKEEKGIYGSTIWTLSNGVRVILKPTDFKADEVRMHAFSPGGTSVYPTSDILQLNQLNAVAGLGGIGKFSNIELEKIMAGKKASAGTNVSLLSEGVSGFCSPKDFETMLQLTYLNFTAPRMDQEAFTSYITRMKASLENQKMNPQKAFQDTLRVALYNNNPRVISLTPELMDKVDYQRIITLYKDRFSDASDFTFILVGTIDLAQVRPLIETYLGGLPATHRKENFKDNKIEVRKGQYQNNFEKKLETPKSSVLLLYSGKCDYTPKNRIVMSMCKQLLDILYTQTIREEQGGTYGVSCSGEISHYPRQEASLGISFDTDPKLRSKMVTSIKEGMASFIAEGPKSDDLKKVKEYMLKSYTQSQKENAYWVGVLDDYYWDHQDINKNYEQLVNSITIADIKTFAKNLVKQNNMIEVSMSSPIEKQ